MKKQSPFILLEVLIALTLVLSCLLPLVRNPLCFFQGEINSLINIELERDALLTFADVKTKLFQEEISWDTIVSLTEKEWVYSKETLPLNLGTLSKQQREKRVTLRMEKSQWKQGKRGGNLGIVQIKICYTPMQKKKLDKTFTYSVVVAKGLKESKHEIEEVPSDID